MVLYKWKLEKNYRRIPLDAPTMAALRKAIIETYHITVDFAFHCTDLRRTRLRESQVLTSDMQIIGFRRPLKEARGGILAQRRADEQYTNIPDEDERALARFAEKVAQDVASVPPPRYVCHRCNVPGHWIDQCTRQAVHNHRKTYRGIPRSMHTQIDQMAEKNDERDDGGVPVPLSTRKEHTPDLTLSLLH